MFIRSSRHVCRRCESQSFSKAGKRRTFFIPGTKPQYAPDLPFLMENILIDVDVDPVGKNVSGSTTQRVRVIAAEQRRISLDQIALTIEKAWVDGKPVAFEMDGNKVHLSLVEVFPQGPAVDSTLEYKVQFKKHNPRRGLYFTGPDAHYPKKRHQVWSQGQDEDNRYWFPTFDYPNQKATSEIIARVPKGFTAVSNGALLKSAPAGDRHEFHYRLGTPHVTYLISLVVAEFSAWEDKGPRGLPVQYFVEPGREADGKRAFSHTPLMIESFEKKIGVNYPYEKYSQVAVQDFIFGGMENTSSTTQTDRTLHDEKAHPDFSSDPLVAHELAHQWFGDLLTCRDWSHGWLNEGFATFMERVWVECDPTVYGGADNAKYYQFNDLKEYLTEDGESYRRPIVCNQYQEPIDLFDRHLYQKGGLVINLLRAQLGETLFWKVINTYVTRFRGQSVETLDLIRVIKDVTGRNMMEFFDQWVFGAGHPEFEVALTMLTSATSGKESPVAELVIEQKQTQGKSFVIENDVKTHLFSLNVRVDFHFEGGKVETHTVKLQSARERVLIPVSQKPLFVAFDPGNTIPKTLKFTRPKEMMLAQLKQDPDCMGRIEAAKQLSKSVDLEIAQALGQALYTDAFWGVQAEVAAILGKFRLDAVEGVLVEALAKTKNSRARASVAKALAEFRSDKVADALKTHAAKDDSYLVEATSVTSWVKTMLPRSRPASAERLATVEKFLIQNLEKDSYLDLTRAATIRAMGIIPGLERGENRQFLSRLAEWTQRGKPLDCRVAAIQALGGILPWSTPTVRHEVLGIFRELVDEESFRIRLALVQSLGSSGQAEAAGLLSHIRDVDSDGRIKRDCQVYISELSEATPGGGAVASVKEELEKVQDELKKMRTEFENLKAGIKS